MQGKKVREAGDSDPPVPSHLILQIHPITSNFTVQISIFQFLQLSAELEAFSNVQRMRKKP